MSKVQSFLSPKTIQVTNKQAQEVYNCLIGYAIANEQQGAITSLPNFIAAWRSKSQNEVIKLLRTYDSELRAVDAEWTKLNEGYKEFSDTEKRKHQTKDAQGNNVVVELDELVPIIENGLYKISDEAKMAEYKEAISLFNYESKMQTISEKQFDLVVFRIKAEDMMKIKSAVSYEGQAMGTDGKPVSTTIFPDYSIMYELIFG